MKRFSAISIVLSVLMLISSMAMAQTAATTTPATTTTPAATTTPANEGFNLGLLAVGQDNIWAVSPGNGGAFFAIGAGLDIAKYQKTLNSAGGALVVTLHAGGAAIATGKYAGDALAYASLNVDLLQLIIGQPITILAGTTGGTTAKLLLGPLACYNAAQDNVAFGGLLNFTLTF